MELQSASRTSSYVKQQLVIDAASRTELLLRPKQFLGVFKVTPNVCYSESTVCAVGAVLRPARPSFEPGSK